jgi:hypothetical protein
MSGSQTPFARRSLGVLSRIAPDRRRHKRHPVRLLGRFMRANKQEYPCRLVDASARGAARLSPVAVELGQCVVAYFDHLGGIEGPVTRGFEGGFAFKIEATHHKPEKFAAKLTWLANRAEIADAAERRHERVAPSNTVSQLARAEGVVLACRVLDVSISGASMQTPARPEIGTEVMLGKLRARVMRPHAQGLRRAIHRQSEPGSAAALFRLRGWAV